MWQLLGFYLCWLELPGYGRALGSDKVKFFGQVTPNAKIVRYEIDIKRVVNRGAVVGFADGNMFVDDRHVYSADGLRVGLFRGYQRILMKNVVVTGIGIVSCIGSDIQEVLCSLKKGRSGITKNFNI